ncbi:hypothetical protein BpHYR1_005387 [Brachionus plicatilis]|uniref:Uncharacterized protein n=1 Tax=Brachionus plicatilis TaxID=10195 RepID=A0A3M7R0X6_BRAPC|nr:hypothetical protein BpHYR1_005387 [Brachionus plicatilis]
MYRKEVFWPEFTKQGFTRCFAVGILKWNFSLLFAPRNPNKKQMEFSYIYIPTYFVYLSSTSLACIIRIKDNKTLFKTAVMGCVPAELNLPCVYLNTVMPCVLVQCIKLVVSGIDAALNTCFSIFRDLGFNAASKVKLEIKFGNKRGFYN